MIHVFICLDQIEDQLARAVTLNMIDATVENLYGMSSVYRIDQITVGNTLDDLLSTAHKSESRWGLFINAGLFLTNKNFRDARHIAKTEPDTVLVGHILDRKHRYFELHEQYFMLNLDEYRKSPAPISYNSNPGSKLQVNRSDENFHDDYTPLWISAGDDVLSVATPAPGADLINWALQTGKSVRPFSESERKKRFYMYPKWDFTENLSKLENQISGIKSRFYLHNTDNLNPLIGREIDQSVRIRRMVTPASGLFPFEYARDMKLHNDFRFVFYDTSGVACWAYRYIMKEWDGKDITDLTKRIPPKLIIGIHDQTKWDEFVDRFGGMSSWLSFFRHYRKNYAIYDDIDIMRQYRNPKFVSEYEPYSDSTFYNLSNIYSYAPTSILRSHEDRWDNFIRHIEFLKTRSPGLYIQFSQPFQYYLGRVDQVHPKKLHMPWRHEGVDSPVDIL